MAQQSTEAAVIENRHTKIVIGSDGAVTTILDKRTGEDRCDRKASRSFASITIGKEVIGSTSALRSGKTLSFGFGDTGARVRIGVRSRQDYFIFDVQSVSGDGITQITFADSAILADSGADPFVCCSLALNLKTNVPEIPGANERTCGICYSRFGLVGASVAVVACPRSAMRAVLQEAVKAAPDLPHSPLGGPWALDAEINRGSYLFNFGGLTEQTVDDWIKLAKQLGMNQIDFHGGSSSRFGDCRPNPDMYPNGRASLKAVIDRLHAAGIKAGLHPYAFFIDKSCPWVTPVPHPGLAKDATFTLAEPLAADAASVTVVEPTSGMSTVTGFFERNSVTIQIDDELIVYSGISREPPYAFTGCTRGAYGTKAAPHEKGAKAHHLKECFGLFAPDGESDLLVEVATAVAETYNECGFDMMYHDALDGEDVLGGGEWGWHYGSRFIFEVWKRLKKPALMEMSTFHHHLWYVRSRVGAMDYPARSQKRFIDIHCEGVEQVVHCTGNRSAEKMFLPAELGWWTVHNGDMMPQVERTFPDDIEYLMCRCLATNTGFALIGIDPSTIANVPAYQRLAPIFRNYEELRHAGYFPESVRRKLGEPGKEFTLEQDGSNWRLRPVRYDKHKAIMLSQSNHGSQQSTTWRTHNPFKDQPLQVRMEPLMSAAPYDSPDAVTLADFTNTAVFTQMESEAGVKADLTSAKVGMENVPGFRSALVSEASSGPDPEATLGRITATSSRDNPDGAWAKIGAVFSPPMVLGQRQAIGVWVYGDGSGALLNFQLRSPRHLAWGIGDHYVVVDFAGWRYFELIEPEGGRTHDYTWPYNADIYGIYRERVNYDSVETLSLWVNNVPRGNPVEFYVSPVKALPLVKSKLANPRVTVRGKTLSFPVEIEVGSCLEFRSLSDCKVYGPKGELVAKVEPEGEVPGLAAGDNEVIFECDGVPGVSSRAWVTLISMSDQVLR